LAASASWAKAVPPAALSEIRTLNADLLAHDSATAVLQQWCADHRLADPPRIVAERARGRDKPADARVRRLLRADPGEIIAYRHVRLACGGVVLSEADNWYRPGRLTADMNRALDTTDTPFGTVVKPLGFHRERLSAVVLGGRRAIIRHQALLETPDGTPFSLVVETYLRAAVGPP
jgi:chorismate-pyruvate lyase